MNGIRTTTRLITALVVGLGTTAGIVGSGDTSETKTKVEQSSPGGTTTETITDKVKQSGNNPPPPTGAADAPAPK